MAYCDPSDLLTGDMPVNTSKSQAFIDAASDEINSALGGIYEMPPEDASIEPRSALLLKRIAVLIATGRLVMAQAVGAEDVSTHGYGTYLLREGKELLNQIVMGDTILEGVIRREAYAKGNAPSLVYEDTYAAIDSFYGFVSRGETNTYVPGA